MKDRGFIICFAVYTLMLIADLITTLRTGQLMQYLESNPLFQFGGLLPIIILNIIVMVIYYFVYKKGSVDARFYVMFSLVTIIITRAFAVINNWNIGSNPPTLEEAMLVTTAMKNEAMLSLAKMNIMPIVNIILTWSLFKIDHRVEIKNETTD